MKTFLYGLALTIFINYPVDAMESLKYIEKNNNTNHLLQSYAMNEVLSNFNSVEKIKLALQTQGNK